MSFARKIFAKKEKPAPKLKRQQQVLDQLKVGHLLDKYDTESDVVAINFDAPDDKPTKDLAKAQKGYEAQVAAFDDAIKQLEAQIPPAGKDELYPGPTPNLEILGTLKAKKEEAATKLASKPPTAAEYQAGFTVLAAVNLKDAASTAQKQLADIADKTRKMAEHKARYIERITRLDAALTELKDYSPASDDQIKKFDQHRAAAQALVAQWPPAYDKGMKELEKVTIGTAVKTASAAWDKLEKSVRGDKKDGGKEVFEQIDALRAEYEKKHKRMMTPEAQTAFETALGEQERALLKAKGDSGAIRAVGTEVASLKQKMLADKLAVDKAYGEYLRVRAELETELAHMSDTDKNGVPVASVDEIAMAEKCLADGRSLASSTRELAAATEIFREGLALCAKLKDENTQLRDEYAKLVDKRATLLTELKALQSSECPAVRSAAIELVDGLEEEANAGLRIGRDVTVKSVVEKITAAEQRLATLKTEDATWVEEKRKIEAADDTVMAALRGIGDALAELEQAIGADSYTHVETAFQARRDTIFAGWREQVQKATTADAIDAAKALGDIDQLITEIKALMSPEDGGGEKLAQQINLGKLEALKDKYDAAREAAKEKVEAFAVYDAIVALQHMKALKAEDAALDGKSTEGAYQAAAEKVTRIGNDAEARTKVLTTEMETAHKDFAALSTELSGILAAIFAKAEKETDVKQRKFHIDLHGTLSASFDQVAALGVSDQISLVKQAIVEGLQLRGEMLTAQKEIEGGAFNELIGDAPAMTYREANKKLAKIKGILAQQFVQIYRYESAFAVSEKLTKLEKALGARTLTKLHDEVAELLAAADRVAGEAKADSHKCKMFDAKLDELALKLESGFFAEAPSFIKEIKAEIARIKKVAHYEGGLATAEGFYTDLSKRLADLQKPALPGDEEGPGDRLEREENAAKAKEAQEKATRATFEANCDLMKKKIEATEMDKEEKKALVKAVDAAEKVAKTDLETARDQLQAVRTRFALVESNPQGLLMHARKQLPSCDKRWQAAVKAYVAGLQQLKTAVGGLVTANDLTADGQKEVSKQIDAVIALFNPMTFVGVTKDFVGAKDERARAGVRERGLAEVRRLSNMLGGDFRLQVLAGCPFVPMSGLQSELNLALLDYENNLLVSM